MKALAWWVTWLGAASLLCLSAASLLQAAEFSPALEQQLEQAHAAEMLSAIVVLPSPVDIRALDLALHAEQANLGRRHTEILAALKYNAETTQPLFRADLEAARSARQVTGYTAY